MPAHRSRGTHAGLPVAALMPGHPGRAPRETSDGTAPRFSDPALSCMAGNGGGQGHHVGLQVVGAEAMLLSACQQVARYPS